MQRLGVLTSGGDCPGLNAVIRAVVHRADFVGAEIIGFEDGFWGVEHDRTIALSVERCRGILEIGGSILGCRGQIPFETPEGTAACLATAERRGLSCLIVIGGNTSMGTAHMAQEAGIPVIGVPKTIDNDVAGTDVTVGFETAIATATESIDRLRTTAETHDRVIVVETMGRDVGWIAVSSGLAGGADVILTPEEPFDPQDVADRLRAIHEAGQDYSLVVIAEGSRFVQDSAQTGIIAAGEGPIRLGGIGHRLAESISKSTGFDTRVTVLGHVQRGGPPTAGDRILATRFGIRAANLALEGRSGIMIGVEGGRLTEHSLAEVAGKIKPVDPALMSTVSAMKSRAERKIDENLAER